MTVNTEKWRNYAYLTVTAVGVLLCAFVGVKYLLPLLLPFLLSWAVAFAVRTPAKKVATLCRLPEGIFRVFFSVILTLGVLGILGFFVVRVAEEGIRFLTAAVGDGRLSAFFSAMVDPVLRLLDGESGEVSDAVQNAFRGLLGEVLSSLGTFLGGLVSAIPRLVLFVVVTVIASVYFSLDLEKINARVRTLLPARAASWLARLKSGFLTAFLRYLRSYAIIALITFAVMTFGFVILRVEYALLLALTVAFLDALPVLGVGTVLIPWAIFQWMLGNPALAVGLLILFGVNEILRQILEPRIVGRSLGIHPVITLMFLYIGYALFGLYGLLLLPCVSGVVQAIFSQNAARETA